MMTRLPPEVRELTDIIQRKRLELMEHHRHVKRLEKEIEGLLKWQFELRFGKHKT